MEFWAPGLGLAPPWLLRGGEEIFVNAALQHTNQGSPEKVTLLSSGERRRIWTDYGASLATTERTLTPPPVLRLFHPYLVSN